MIENAKTDISESKYIVNISLMVVIGACLILLVSPPVSFMLGVLGIMLSWKARQSSKHHSVMRSIANISFIIAIVVILISVVFSLLSFPSSITGRVVK